MCSRAFLTNLLRQKLVIITSVADVTYRNTLQCVSNIWNLCLLSVEKTLAFA